MEKDRLSVAVGDIKVILFDTYMAASVNIETPEDRGELTDLMEEAGTALHNLIGLITYMENMKNGRK